jgi:hypothetical protein
MTDKLFIPRKGWARSAGDASHRDELANYLAIERWANSLKVGGGKEYATVVVAASNTHSSGKTFADFVCNGTNDAAVVQQAVNAVIALGGGKVLLLEGIYYFNADSIIIDRPNVWLCGCGARTMIWTVPTMVADSAAVYLSSFFIVISDLAFVEDTENILGDPTVPEYMIRVVDYGQHVFVERCRFFVINKTAINVVATARAIIGHCVTAFDMRGTFLRAQGPVLVTDCTTLAMSSNAGDKTDVAVRQGLVANCVFGSITVEPDIFDADIEGLVIANSIVEINMWVTRTNTANQTCGPLLVANCVLPGLRIFGIEAPVHFLNCVFKPGTVETTSVTVTGPVAADGYVHFESCLFDHRGSSIGQNLAIGDASMNPVARVSVMNNRFIGSPAEHIRVAASANSTVIVGNVFVGSSTSISDSGTNTHLTFPTGPQGNNFVLP